MPNEVAPEGYVYVCMACGKMSKDQHGEQKITYGWDASCVLNSMLIAESRLKTVGDGCGRIAVDVLPEPGEAERYERAS